MRTGESHMKVFRRHGQVPSSKAPLQVLETTVMAALKELISGVSPLKRHKPVFFAPRTPFFSRASINVKR